jgi:hypothetical protein
MSGKSKQPILASVFRFFGAVFLIAAALMFIAAAVDGSWYALVAAVGMVFAALFYFGLAQIVVFIAQIAADSSEIAARLAMVQSTTPDLQMQLAKTNELLRHGNAERDETNKALQWMLENWPARAEHAEQEAGS